MENKTSIIGAGYLGKRISETLGYSLTATRVQGDLKELRDYLDRENPKTVICTLGRTGRPNIDWCETHQQETLEGNVIAPIRLAAECAKRGIYFVNIGSGCIYFGDKNGKGFNEQDEPNFYGPQFYGKTKILFEKLLQSMPTDSPWLNIRIRMPIDDRPHERNLIDKLKSYSRVIDIQNSMTTVPHLIPAIRELTEKNRIGIYNITNPGTISAAEIMDLYKTIVDPSHNFEVFSLGELDKITPGKRSNCKIDCSKLGSEGIVLPDIYDAVTDCLWKYKKALK